MALPIGAAASLSLRKTGPNYYRCRTVSPYPTRNKNIFTIPEKGRRVLAFRCEKTK
jgi:hypothetical protein